MGAKFENVKVGDTVYLHHGVRYGFNREKWFYIPVSVIKITKTQFTCSNNKRYQKDYGNEIGGGYNDRVNQESETVFDQTKELKAFAIRIKEISKATTLIFELDKYRNRIDPDVDIRVVEDFVVYAEQLLSEIKKD